ncbi:hypothetical protein BGZ46_008381 [Entomortierella lignicola]|nr:hypothetical protein BGZ46_008381 [Entomortierella lignicola]
MEDCRVTDLLAIAPRLQFLGLNLCISKQVSLERLNHSLESHASLRRVSLGLRCSWDPILLPRLLQTCGRFECLKIHLFEMHKNGSDSDGQLDACNMIEAAIENMREVQIKKLSIWLVMLKRRPRLLPSLLKKCTLLESFEIVERRDIERLNQLLSVLQSNTFPHLKHLRISDETFQQDKAEISSKLIRALGIQCLHREYRSSNSSGYEVVSRGRGLESFVAHSPFVFHRQSARALIECHANTLVTLDLSRQMARKLPLFMDIVCSLPRLQSLKIGVWLGSGLGYFCDMSGMDASLQSPWVCSELVTLDMELSLPSESRETLDDLAQNNLLLDRCLVYLFNQLGRLIKLKEMSLNFSINLLELKRGYLHRLSELKQLRGLDLRSSVGLRLGEAEAMWMSENWTRLVHLLLPPKSSSHDTAINNSEEFEAIMFVVRPWIRIE